MTQHMPIFRSPITGPDLRSEATAASSLIALSDLTGVPVIRIQGQADRVLQAQFGQIPAKIGDLVEVDDGLLARLTPTEFYLFGRAAEAGLPSASDLDQMLTGSNLFAHATDFTHGKAVLRLTGYPAPDLLSNICGLDFHDTVFADRRVAQTSAAKIKTLIARYDEGAPTYFLHVDRPLAQYFWETVWDAGQAFSWTTTA